MFFLNNRYVSYDFFLSLRLTFSIEPSDMKTLRDKLKETYKLDYAECQDSAAHKLFFLSPDLLDAWGIRYNIVKQEKWEFLLIFPLAFQQGFNVGLNVAEALNFAKKEWINPGQWLPSCVPENGCHCSEECQANAQLAKLVTKLSKGTGT